MLILDIDLDFFVTPILQSWSIPTDRADPEQYRPLAWDSIQSFVETNLRLNRKTPIPGAVFENHVEAFDFLVARKETQLHLIHLDAHSDLGMGGTSFKYICEDLLHRPPDRRMPERRDGQGGLCSANWLAFLLAQQNVAKLDLVFPNCWAPHNMDIPGMYWRSSIAEDGPMEFPILAEGGWEKWVTRRKHDRAVAFDPPIQYSRCDAARYRIPATPDIVLLTRSPNYTPTSADGAFEKLQQYIIKES